MSIFMKTSKSYWFSTGSSCNIIGSVYIFHLTLTWDILMQRFPLIFFLQQLKLRIVKIESTHFGRVLSWHIYYKGHYIMNPNKARLKGNPSNLPYICIVWSSPKMGNSMAPVSQYLLLAVICCAFTFFFLFFAIVTSNQHSSLEGPWYFFRDRFG